LKYRPLFGAGLFVFTTSQRLAWHFGKWEVRGDPGNRACGKQRRRFADAKCALLADSLERKRAEFLHFSRKKSVAGNPPNGMAAV
jgi:hypothetical protein